MAIDPDLLVVCGTLLCLLAFPALLQSFTHENSLRTPMVLLAVGISMLAYAVSRNPSSYSIDQIPDVFVRVFGTYIS